MSAPAPPSDLAALRFALGGIPLDRIRTSPDPGSATVADAARTKGCELIDGTLVEKAMGVRESILAVFLARKIDEFSDDQGGLGLVAGEAGMWSILDDLVRMPDVSFISRDRLPGGELPDVPVPALVPNLAVEVVSDSNTAAELARKRREYFAAGVRLVWIVHPRPRTIDVYSALHDVTTLTETDTLSGGDVLPGFSLPLTALFGRLDRR